jgi:AAA domain
VNQRAIDAAELVASEARGDVRGRLADGGAVVVEAVAGGGKSTFVVETVDRLADEATIVVVAPTNEQVYALVRTLADRRPGLPLHYVPASSAELPFPPPPGVQVCRPARQARGGRILVATLHKIADALGRGDIDRADLLIVDEAFQADAGIYYRVADIAPTHLLVGDAGQIDPFSTAAGAAELRGLAEDPVRTSVEVLLENHPDTPRHRLPITRRLDERAVPAVRAFYSLDHHFEAAVPTGIRELRFATRLKHDRRQRTLDAILRDAGVDGWAHVELPAAPALPTDPQLVSLAADLVATAMAAEMHGETGCERHGSNPLAAERIAVGASHRDQVRSLRRALVERGVSGVTVDTANRLQGLEYDLVVALHPLAGLPAPDTFHLESGRLCVLATRHRHACIVLGRSSDRTLLRTLPPSGEAYLGRDDEPLLDGWDVHQRFLDALDPHRHSLAA